MDLSPEVLPSPEPPEDVDRSRVWLTLLVGAAYCGLFCLLCVWTPGMLVAAVNVAVLAHSIGHALASPPRTTVGPSRTLPAGVHGPWSNGRATSSWHG